MINSMIKRTLTKPLTLHELFNKLFQSHTLKSLEIELKFLEQIGSVGFENGKYFYKRKLK